MIPSFGASSSRVKNVINSFNEVDDATHVEEEIFDDVFNESDSSIIDTSEDYMNLGSSKAMCNQCGAIMWIMKQNNKSNKNSQPTFKNGQVQLPREEKPPQPLASLLSGSDKSAHFRQNIRVYNNMFMMCFSGRKIDHKINNGRAPYCFKVRGMNLHLMGSLLPEEGQTPKFCQLYIYDTENEVHNRLNAMGSVRNQVDHTIVEALIKMLDEHNHLVSYFRTARERFKSIELDEFKLVLISLEAANGRQNIIGPSNEVAGLIVNDNADISGIRDIVVETHLEGLKRVYETDVFFIQLQFPILFPHGRDGFHTKIKLKKNKKMKHIGGRK